MGKKPSKDIAHYKCVICDYVQNSPSKCKWCNCTYTDMILCSGKNGRKFCLECIDVIYNSFENYVYKNYIASTTIQKYVRGYLVRKLIY